MALEPAGISLQAEGFKQYVKQLDAIEKKQREAFEAEFKGTGKSFDEVTKAAKAYEKQLNDTAKAEQKAAAEAERLAQAQIKAADKARKAQIKATEDEFKRIEKIIKERKKAKLEAEKLAAAQKTAAATQRQAFISTGQAVIDFTKQVATAAFELGKLGAQFEGQQTGLNNLSASFGQSGSAIQKSIQAASKGTLSGLDAITAANQGLLLGVAKTPEEFAELTNSALVLGNLRQHLAGNRF
jgi:DNA repair exonuclease SbcCD ATPase subunit